MTRNSDSIEGAGKLSADRAFARNPDLRIRPAREEDVPIIYSMLRESAIAQGSENDLCANPVNLRQDGFSTEPRFHCLLAELHGNAAGLILYFFVYSTWTSRKGLYVEDLYVAPPFRRQAVARALMMEVARIAIDSDCRYVQWAVLRSNSPAVRFYGDIGAVALSEWEIMRVSGEQLEQLAAGMPDGRCDNAKKGA